MTAPTYPKLEELIAVLERLRAPGGCAWDAEQTHESLVRYLIEECYELVDAIETGTREDLIEELGDVLYQVIFHADIAAHTPGEDFTIEDVAEHMTRKMVGRHPHVFGDAVADTPDAVMANWETLKAEEKPHRSSTLDGIPNAMPSLLLADKLVGKARAVGAALPDAKPPLPDSAPDAASDAASEAAPDAESNAARDGSYSAAAPAAAPAASPRTEDELGDLLLALVVDAKSRGLDAERALRGRLRVLQHDIREAESARVEA